MFSQDLRLRTQDFFVLRSDIEVVAAFAVDRDVEADAFLVVVGAEAEGELENQGR